MASEAIHKRQAKHNEGLAEELAASLRHKDWVVTTAFYSALHWVEAAMAGDHPPRHPETDCPEKCPKHLYRQDWVDAKCGVQAILAYGVLYQNSRTARYLERCAGRTAQDFFSDEVAKDGLLVHLQTVKADLGYA